MRIACHEACACLSSCYEYAEHAFAVTILTCDKVLSDVEAFQKTCILGESIIQAFNLYYQTNYLTEFVNFLDIAQSFDFYGFCRIPRYFFLPYQADRIDDNALLDDLEIVLCENWGIGECEDPKEYGDPDVHQFAKEQLTAFLTHMSEEEIAYHSEEDLRTALKNCLFLTLKKNKDNTPEGFDPDFIDLNSLSIPLKKTRVLEVIIDFTFIFVDIGCIPVFLQEWSLINLSGVADRLSQIRFLSWISQQSLDDNVRRLMCAGFILQFFNALYTLCLTDQSEDAKAAKWMMAASAAEFLYNLTILKRKNIRIITGFAILAKSIGLIQFMITPKPSFLTDA